VHVRAFVRACVHAPFDLPPIAHHQPITHPSTTTPTHTHTLEARDRLGRTRCGGYTTTPWATAAAPLWRRRSRVMSCVLRHTRIHLLESGTQVAVGGQGHTGRRAGPETRPQPAAAGGAAECKRRRQVEVVGPQPARDDGAEAPSGDQQHGTATRAL
jgi:hypothetical protein